LFLQSVSHDGGLIYAVHHENIKSLQNYLHVNNIINSVYVKMLIQVKFLNYVVKKSILFQFPIQYVDFLSIALRITY
jgi:hypothetical protein